MILQNGDGTRREDSECVTKNIIANCYIDPINYEKLAQLTYRNGIQTFDISLIINMVITNYPMNLELK